MRKIEQQMLQAMGSKSRQSVTLGNTTVTHDKATAHDVRVYLHDNLIAVLSENEVRFTLAGWNTPTTRSRVNRILSYARGFACVYCKGGEPFLETATSVETRDKAITRELRDDEWITLPAKVWC